MKKALLHLIVLFVIIPTIGKSQVYTSDSVISYRIISLSDSTTYPSNIIPDTSSSPLWQLGKTHKSYFTSYSAGIRGMVTDTLHPYRINANNWFVFKIDTLYYNEIISFWHSYETDSQHAGGTVEISSDGGFTWQNIKGPCNQDGLHTGMSGIYTDSFYSLADTLLTGEPCFTGKSKNVHSFIQLFEAFLERSTSDTACYFGYEGVLLRFRFKSDSTADSSLAGWMIDSIATVAYYWTGTGQVKNTSTLPFTPPNPNPSPTGIFQFAAIENAGEYTITIYNTMGAKIVQMPCCNMVDLSKFAHGWYYYRVSDGKNTYCGKLLWE